MFGVLGGVLLCAGVGCEYLEIWKTGGVDGISFLFCGIDAAGDVFSVLSVCQYLLPMTFVIRHGQTSEPC